MDMYTKGWQEATLNFRVTGLKVISLPFSVTSVTEAEDTDFDG